MKKLILTVLVAVFSFSVASAQKVVQDKDGNFIAASASREKPKASGKFYQDSKGKKWPVFVSARGKYFALVVSKNGKEYRKYLN